MRVPNAIRKYRLLCAPPLSQRALGDLVGLTQTRISKYELGVIQPTLEVALAIAVALRTPIDKVFYGLCERAGDRVKAVSPTLPRAH